MQGTYPKATHYIVYKKNRRSLSEPTVFIYIRL